jgi:hypothetical protein
VACNAPYPVGGIHAFTFQRATPCRISIVQWSQVLNQYQRRADLILAQHFPPGALPRNELPNTLAEI